MRLRRFLVSTVLLGGLGMPAVAAAESEPPRIVDDRGAAVELAHKPQRIAAISTFAADTLVALGITPVGVSSFGDRPVPDFLGEPVKTVPSLGQRAATNLEQLAALRPDLTIAIRRYTEPHADKFQEIAPYLAYDVITYADSLRAVDGIATAVGQAARGRELNAAFEALVGEFHERAPGGLSAALLVSSGEAPYAYYDHFLPMALLGKLKASNVIGPSPTPDQAAPMGYRISLEKLLALNPDVIFLFASNTKHAYAANPIWPYLKAVQTGRVYEVGQHWKEGAGPIAREYILREMAYRLYPDTFPEPLLPATIRGGVLQL